MNRRRNLAIIAHVDHGKTTLVDQLLKQSGTFSEHESVSERVMDSNDLEKERGITIVSKNCAVNYNGVHINIVDTPGHADFGGEVERVLSMVDGVLLLVDAVEGPMPQTRFVTKKALELGLLPIVIVNKIDRSGSRPDWVINETFDLFDKLGASEQQLDFPVLFTSALKGYATLKHEDASKDMHVLFDQIISHIPEGSGDIDAPFQMQVTSLDYSTYVGKIVVGRIKRGAIKPKQEIVVVDGPNGEPKKTKITQIQMFEGLTKQDVNYAEAGDIVLINGIEDANIGSTLCDPLRIEPLKTLQVDKPTLCMNFLVNTSPLAGRDGKFVTSRQIRERLKKELKSNVALKVSFGKDSDVFEVFGRGELHLTILLENLRREGFELAVSRPKVVFQKDENGRVLEPYESLTVDLEEAHQGSVMEALGMRKGELLDMISDGKGRVRLEYVIPSRGLLGFQSDFLSLTRGTGLLSHVFDHYGDSKGNFSGRKNGSLVSQEDGKAVAFALWKLQERGKMFLEPGEEVYEGMIIGIHSRENDLVVNPIKEKKLTNVRASGKDEHIDLVTPIKLTLERAIDFIEDDELLEVTPSFLRIRKKELKESQRRRSERVA
ncbi:MAG: translational GTPase TypA [Betaproteobacteria bacterium TMED156]|nr:MAG: translational GTPase TypA [Betaproteobacteria bacterium TMED156]